MQKMISLFMEKVLKGTEIPTFCIFWKAYTISIFIVILMQFSF